MSSDRGEYHARNRTHAEWIERRRTAVDDVAARTIADPKASDDLVDCAMRALDRSEVSTAQLARSMTLTEIFRVLDAIADINIQRLAAGRPLVGKGRTHKRLK